MRIAAIWSCLRWVPGTFAFGDPDLTRRSCIAKHRAMISVATALLAFRTPIKPFHTRRTSTPLLQITDGMSRQQMVAAMEGMKATKAMKAMKAMKKAECNKGGEDDAKKRKANDDNDGDVHGCFAYDRMTPMYVVPMWCDAYSNDMNVTRCDDYDGRTNDYD